FHPLVWIDLITNAAKNEVFSPIDIGTQDPFAIDICCAVLRAFQWPRSKLSHSPDAVRDYFHSDMTAYLLKMFAVFVCPSNTASIEPSLRILLVFAEFLMSRLRLGKQANTAAWQSTGPLFHVIMSYSELVNTRCYAMGPRSLEVLINFMFDRYNSNHYSSVYASFIITRCIFEGYLSIFEHHSNSRIEASVLQEHIKYLHTPNILFNVCSILAIGPYGLDDEDCRKRIRRDILLLVRIQQDAPTWDDCRYRLEQLLEEDGMGFFYQQARIDGIRRVPLSAEGIAYHRSHIHFAIETLNAFFSGTLDDEPENDSVDRLVAIPDDSPISQTQATWRVHLHRLLPWHGRREAGDHDAAEGV
ncbi:hypothetical protein EDD18DRAFT_1138104, partial [Armillaria luteobubalina]